MEQIFVLTEGPPPEATCASRATSRSPAGSPRSSGGLRFEAPGLPAFSYAAPIAFDANQKRIPVRVDAVGSRLSLVLDGAALDGARWPVTIDPLLGMADVDDTDDTTNAVDIAYNPRRGEFLVVYDATHQFSLDSAKSACAATTRMVIPWGRPS